MAAARVSGPFSGSTVSKQESLGTYNELVRGSAKAVEQIYKACHPDSFGIYANFPNAGLADPGCPVSSLERAIYLLRGRDRLDNADWAAKACATVLTGIQPLKDRLFLTIINGDDRGAGIAPYGGELEGQSPLLLRTDDEANHRISIMGSDLYLDLLGTRQDEITRKHIEAFVPDRSKVNENFLKNFSLLYAIRESGIVENIQNLIAARGPDFSRNVLVKIVEYAQGNPGCMFDDLNTDRVPASEKLQLA